MIFFYFSLSGPGGGAGSKVRARGNPRGFCVPTPAPFHFLICSLSLLVSGLPACCMGHISGLYIYFPAGFKLVTSSAASNIFFISFPLFCRVSLVKARATTVVHSILELLCLTLDPF